MTEADLPRLHLKYPQISSLQQEHFHFFFYEATLLPLNSTTKFQTSKTIKSLIHKKIIVPLQELVEREIKMKQTKFVNSIIFKNVHWQLEQRLFQTVLSSKWLLGQFAHCYGHLLCWKTTNWSIFDTFLFKISIQAYGFAFRY